MQANFVILKDVQDTDVNIMPVTTFRTEVVSNKSNKRKRIEILTASTANVEAGSSNAVPISQRITQATSRPAAIVATTALPPTQFVSQVAPLTHAITARPTVAIATTALPPPQSAPQVVARVSVVDSTSTAVASNTPNGLVLRNHVVQRIEHYYNEAIANPPPTFFYTTKDRIIDDKRKFFETGEFTLLCDSRHIHYYSKLIILLLNLSLFFITQV